MTETERDEQVGQSKAAGNHNGTSRAASDPDLAVQLSRLARSLENKNDVTDTLDAIVHAAVNTVPGAQHASISTTRKRREVATVASTDELARTFDEIQYTTGQGPCLDTLDTQKTILLLDLDAERRWPKFTKQAIELGVGSILALQLYVRDGELGALNLYSQESAAFDADSEHVALLFAAHAAVAMASAQQQDQMRTALDSRDLIGQAKGILMERFKVTGDQAFRLLVGVSQQTNRKLTEIATDLVYSGDLPTS